MPSCNVLLTVHHEKLIAELVGSGRSQNASEILRDGLRILEERDAREAAKLEALRDAARVGLDAIESGAYRDFGSFEELGAYLKATTAAVIAEAASR